ncbi:MAG: membrane protein insertion efficiency factor YidD [Legionellales bacterium]|nr:membrane protein insertion efficiency factor YidD [Legionellales bacterium]
MAALFSTIFQKSLIILVRAYQMGVRPYLGVSCRFQPSCSAYAIEALEAWGPYKGSWLTIKRLMRCHPFAKGGVDVVPENTKK